MKILKKITVLCLCAIIAVGLCGCGEKPIPEYNVPVEGRTVDATDPKSVIENALMVDVFDKLSQCETMASVYDEYAKEQKGKVTKYYVVATVGGYVYENGKLVRNFGNSPFPAVVTLKQVKEDYQVVGFNAGRSFAEEEDRDAYIAENFPKGTTTEVLFKDRSKGLFEAEKLQIIANYGIDEGEFSTGEELVELLPVTNEAYYTLIEYFPIYPEWLGNTSRIEEGKRYTYTTSYEGEDGGKGVVTYVKTNDSGEEVERYEIKVDGDNVEIPDSLIADYEEEEPVSEGTSEPEVIVVEPSDEEGTIEGEGTTERTPEELEEIMKEFDYDDGIEYTLVD